MTTYSIEPSRRQLDARAAERGRDTAALTISVFGQPPEPPRQQVDDFLNAGAARVTVWPAHCDTEAAMGEPLEKMAATLLR